jgi:hypothetical protein
MLVLGRQRAVRERCRFCLGPELVGGHVGVFQLRGGFGLRLLDVELQLGRPVELGFLWLFRQLGFLWLFRPLGFLWRFGQLGFFWLLGRLRRRCRHGRLLGHTAVRR